jgi:hypothetical protein
MSNETHAVAQRKQEQMEKMRKAFGLGEVSRCVVLAVAAALTSAASAAALASSADAEDTKTRKKRADWLR